MSLDTRPAPHPAGHIPAAPEVSPGRACPDVARVEHLYRELLAALGEDPTREGLRDTPRRAAAAWKEFLDDDPGPVDSIFAEDLLTQDTCADGPAGAYVVVRGIVVWTMCEHHLLPFRLEAAIGYVPVDGNVLGLSKLVRLARRHAHRLQLQERWTAAVAQEVSTRTASPDVGVWAEGEHLCMSMRGVHADSARTRTAVLLGRVRTDPGVYAQLAAAAQTLPPNGAFR